MKNFKYYISLILISLFVFGCDNDDLTPQSYDEINEFDLSQFSDSTYTALAFKEFNLSPEIKQSIGTATDNLEFEWVAQPQGPSVSLDEQVVLGTEKDLNYVVQLAPNKYDLILNITDPSSGVTWSEKAGLEVVSSTGEGWLILNDVDGKARMDMLAYLSNEVIQHTDLLTTVESEAPLLGTPLQIVTAPFGTVPSPLGYGIYITTSESGTTRVDSQSFAWNEAQNMRYEYSDSSVDNPVLEGFYPKGRSEAFVIDDGKIYWYNRTYQKVFGSPMNKDNTGRSFRASEHVAIGPTGGFYNTVVFDEDTQSFMKVYFFDCGYIPDGPLFSYTNTGKDLVYMSSSNYKASGSAEAFFIQKDSEGKYFIGNFNVTTSAQGFYAEVSPTDFDQATQYAFSPEFGHLMYNVGSKVYQYDFFAGETFLMKDFGDEEVTYLSFERFEYQPFKYHDQNFHKRLIVGTYNPSGPTGSNGKLGFYDIPPVNGAMELYEEYSGFGKIVSVTFRETN